MNVIKVTCAIIINNNKIMAAKRSQLMPHAGFWEFPGGKMEDNESADKCLEREIREELQCDVIIQQQLKSFYYAYPDKQIELIPFVCTVNNNAIHPTEHEKIVWLKSFELNDLDWLAADIPIALYVSENFDTFSVNL